MDNYNLAADLLATFRASPDVIKALWLLVPPVFVLGLLHLGLRWREGRARRWRVAGRGFDGERRIWADNLPRGEVIEDGRVQPVDVVAHSFGGCAVGLAPSGGRVRRVVMVGAQFAYWRDYAANERWRLVGKWHVVMPLLTRLCG